MSSVVLSPTHIGCDHTVHQMCFPHETKVDIGYRKLFISPSKKFIVGTCGQFIPEEIDTPEMWIHLAEMCIDVISKRLTPEYSDNLTLFSADREEIKKATLAYLSVFDASGHSLFVTKSYRFMVFYSKKYKSLIARRVGDYVGIGSGGMLGAGMLIGKMKIHDIWQSLHDLDPNTSVEHTVIPLSILRKEGIKDI